MGDIFVFTRSILLAAAVAFALPMGAGTVLAQAGGNNSTGSYLGSQYRMDRKHAEGGESTKMGHHHHRHTAQAHAPAHQRMARESVPTGATSTNQLNEMSLAAARQGQSFAPAAPAAK